MSWRHSPLSPGRRDPPGFASSGSKGVRRWELMLMPWASRSLSWGQHPAGRPSSPPPRTPLCPGASAPTAALGRPGMRLGSWFWTPQSQLDNPVPLDTVILVDAPVPLDTAVLPDTTVLVDTAVLVETLAPQPCEGTGHSAYGLHHLPIAHMGICS